MNREIKFRAWDKKWKHLYEVTSIFPRKKAVMCSCCRYKFDDIELMQYTGLKDKNGVEIYEGDIIRKFGQKGYGKRIKEVELILQVVYEVGVSKSLNGKDLNRCSEFTTKQLNIQEWNRVSWSMFCDCEVIGNIYENPELLKESEE